MKKLITMLFMLMLFCSMTVTVMAADAGVGTDKNVVNAGETVTVTVKMNETLTGNFRNVQGQLNYDTSALTYVSHTMGGSYSRYVSSDMPNRSYFTFSNTDFTKEGFKEVPQGTIATVVFKANGDLSETHLSATFTLNMNVQDIYGQTENSNSSSSVLVCTEHAYDEGKVTTEATCSKDGVKTFTCTYSGCGATKTEKIPATGVHTWNSGKVTTKATCSKDGVKTYTCKCGKTKKVGISKIKSVKLSTSSYVYNNKTKTPSVVIKDSKGNTLKKNTDYTVKYASGRKSVGKYTVKVTFKGKYSGTKSISFSIVPKGTKLSSVKAMGNKKATVKWSTQKTQTSGYQIQYSTKKNFSSYKTKLVASNKTKSVTLTKLSKKTYYVRVRTYKTVKVNGKSTKLYSSWSSAKSVKVK